MATAFWLEQKGRKRVLVVKWRDAAGRWIGPRRAKGCRTLEQAQRFADDLERQAERARHGLEALPGEQRITWGVLVDAWWERSGRRRRSESKHGFRASLEKNLGELRGDVLNAATAGDFAARLEALLGDKVERGELSPATANHLRAGAFRVFQVARDPKSRQWRGENPIAWVKRWKVPRRRYETLARDQVAPVLAAFPEPVLGAPWRWIAATCIYTGARPGEVMGLWKEDVDLDAGVLTIRRSWSSPWPKDDEPRQVLVVPELRPYLTAAMRVSPSDLVFPRANGKPFGPAIRFNLVDHLRRAAAHAGFVEGWDHTCRWCKARRTRGEEGAPELVTWRHADGAQRTCPSCGRKLWASPVPRPIRFYDLRHTNATLLRKARVDLGTVQKSLGHSSPEITAGTYDHSELEDDRPAIERALTFGVRPVAVVAAVGRGEPVVRSSPTAEGEGRIPVDFSGEDAAFVVSGRQDLNLRPLAPQGRTSGYAGGRTERTESQEAETTGSEDDPPGAPRARRAPGVTGCGEPVVSRAATPLARFGPDVRAAVEQVVAAWGSRDRAALRAALARALAAVDGGVA
jgi:integrase